MIENLMDDDEGKDEEQVTPAATSMRPKSEHIDSWQRHLDENETIVLSSLVVKKRYRFTDVSSKHRHLILTDKPRIMYLNPETAEKRGEIPWSDDMSVDRSQRTNRSSVRRSTPVRFFFTDFEFSLTHIFSINSKFTLHVYI